MTSTEWTCTLCGQPLLQFLYNADGDFILNCSSATCLYGVLHARIFRADEVVGAEPHTAAKGDDMPDFSSMLGFDQLAPAASLNDSVQSPEELPLSPDNALTVKDHSMIDSWVQELIRGPGEPLSADAPGPPATETHTTPEILQELKPKPGRAVKRVGAASRAQQPAAIVSATKAVRDQQKPKRTTQRGLTGSAVLRKAQAKAAALRASADLSEETPSEAGSLDSGVHSDLSSGSATSTLTPIQRLLHIEEAKKRSWGTTGMPGYKPTAGNASRIKLF